MTDRRSARRTTDLANWYETPVFEADPDERMEERATSGRGPMRIAASALLRVDARRAGLGRGQSASPRPESPARQPPATVATPVATQIKVAARATPTEQLAADELAWQTWCRSEPDNSLADSLAQLDLDRWPHPGIRGRIGRHLDRWAEREVAVWQRLERTVLVRTPPPKEPLE